MRANLGLEVPNDREGCLQDAHWAAGLVGSFCTYTIGNIMAAQLFEVACGSSRQIRGALDEGDVGRTLQQLFQYGTVKHDVPVEQDGPALQLAFRTENGEQLSGFLVPIIIVLPDIGQRDRFLLIAAHDGDFLNIGLIEGPHGSLEDGFAFDIQQTLGFVLDQRK